MTLSAGALAGCTALVVVDTIGWHGEPTISIGLVKRGRGHDDGHRPSGAAH
ncbi:MAG: hypothetical protein WCH93_10095 [Actinomycetota bacterium]